MNKSKLLYSILGVITIISLLSNNVVSYESYEGNHSDIDCHPNTEGNDNNVIITNINKGLDLLIFTTIIIVIYSLVFILILKKRF